MKRAEWKAEQTAHPRCGTPSHVWLKRVPVCRWQHGCSPKLPKFEHLMPLMMAFPGGSVGNETTCNAGDLGLIPGLERSPEEEMATHSSILAWKIPWTEEPGGLQPMGSQRVEHNLETNSQLTNAFKSIQLSSLSVAMTNKKQATRRHAGRGRGDL